MRRGAVWVVAAVCSGVIGCSSDDKRGAVGHIEVDTLLGEQVLVDGGIAARFDVGERAQVPAGEHAVQVRVDDAWSEPVRVEVPSDETVVVEIPWDALPVQYRDEKLLLAMGDEAIEAQGHSEHAEERRERIQRRTGIDPQEASERGRLVARGGLDHRVDFTTGEGTAAGRPLVIEDITLHRYFKNLGLKPGDRIFAVDGRPVGNDLAPLVELVNAVSMDGESRQLSLLRDGAKWRIHIAARVPEARDGRASKRARRGDERGADSLVRAFEARVPRVLVYSRPRGTIVLDGEPTDKTTPGSVKVEPGTHSVAIEFEDGTRSVAKSVEASERAPVKVSIVKNDGASEDD